MKIQIRENGGAHMTFYFPTTAVAILAGSRTTVRVCAKVTKVLRRKLGKRNRHVTESHEESWKSIMDVPTEPPDEKALREAGKKLRKCLRQYRNLTLVEVESADGDYVKIVL